METSSRYPWGKGTVVNTQDITTNDSNKTFTVPDGKKWKIGFIHATLITTATVGNRVLRIFMYKAGGAVLIWHMGVTANVVASKTGVIECYPGAVRSTTATDVPQFWSTSLVADIVLRANMPQIILNETDYIQIYDSAAVDAAADDLYCYLEYIEYDA